ncbi:MAG TPA: glycosyltransferase family 2 protein [Gemmatimonadaceae bacterium]|jgi:GT2 family glycosyltransferase|nr:glycosyltransferase family 2 protein [Gemmatimonadaceae bacterium]
MNVWVILVNWNGAADTEVCLQSLLDARPQPYGIAVVDNGSREGEIDRLRAWAKAHGIGLRLEDADPAQWPADRAPRPGEVLLLRSATNRGFSGGNNVALAYTEPDPAATHFLLLNNDAAVTPSYFGDLAASLAGYADTGLASGTIYEMTPPNRVWYAGGRILPVRTMALHDLEVPVDSGVVPTEFICGCTMLISSATLHRLGHLPECYFPCYLEDTEYSQRARDAGIPVLYVPGAVAYHKGGGSLGPMALSPRVTYTFNRHRGFWARRNLRGGQRLAALLYLVVTKPIRAAIDVVTGHPRVAWATLTGTLDGLFSPRARDIR